MRVVFLVALFAAVVAANVTPLTDSEHEFLFSSWTKQHGKKFGDDVFERFAIFKDNLQKIREHNAANNTWTMAMNEFGAMTQEEFGASMIGFGGVQKAWATKTFTGANTVAAATIDWTTKGVVTPVKNQGQCGSCWAFSTTGSLEGAHAIKTGNLVSLSEQMLVDCDTQYDNGCGGGRMDNAFSWIKENGGLCTEDDYSYTARDGKCKKSCEVVEETAPVQWTDVAHNEQAMAKALTNGPVSIAIEADQSAFQFYSGGVFTGRCGTQLDHGVLAVGYGVLDGKAYWKVKNSWGASWGMDGYILLEKGKHQQGGQCGILLSASYPTL